MKWNVLCGTKKTMSNTLWWHPFEYMARIILPSVGCAVPRPPRPLQPTEPNAAAPKHTHQTINRSDDDITSFQPCHSLLSSHPHWVGSGLTCWAAGIPYGADFNPSSNLRLVTTNNLTPGLTVGSWTHPVADKCLRYFQLSTSNCVRHCGINVTEMAVRQSAPESIILHLKSIFQLNDTVIILYIADVCEHGASTYTHASK